MVFDNIYRETPKFLFAYQCLDDNCVHLFIFFIPLCLKKNFHFALIRYIILMFINFHQQIVFYFNFKTLR